MLTQSELNDVRDIWTNGDTYDNRVADLTASLLTPNGTVVDDGVVRHEGDVGPQCAQSLTDRGG